VTVDMTQFYQIFFEESSELLSEMETLLLKIDMAAPDKEELDAIFRVAHSIKGGASTFGFTDMAEVTHVLESLLDRVRKGELVLTSAMVDQFLKARDVVTGQLAGHRGDGQADPLAAQTVCAALTMLASGEGAAASQPVAAAAQPTAATAPQPANDEAGGASSARTVPSEPEYFQLEFNLPESANAKALDNLRANLGALGRLDELSAPHGIAGNYLWRLVSNSPETDIWEAIAFNVDPAGLKVQREAEAPGYGFFEDLYQAIVPPLPASDALSVPAPRLQVVASATPAAAVLPLRASDQAASQGATPKVGRRESDKAAAADATSIRVGVEKVDQLINLAGELVITQAMLVQTASQLDPVLHEKLLNGLAQLDRNTRDLQESVMSIRMMPISFVFSRFPRVVRDLASKLGKEVELKTIGESTELDKGLIEKIADPLNHLVRNSIDHGIESPDKRRAAGKPEKGSITLKASHQGGNIVIEVADDGAGLNRERILEKARCRGMAAPDTMSDAEVWMLIFEAGFSTAEVVTDVSGRGVGMDVVRRNIQALGGSVEIESAFGAGSRISIRLPLTLAILDGLSVKVGDQMFIIPLNHIIESLQPAAGDVRSIHSQGTVVHVRGDYLPVLRLHEMFNIRPDVADMARGIMVILEAEGAKMALFVDELVGQHQVVIKSLETNYRRVRGISGATIMGDGKVALIIDAALLVRSVKPDLRLAA
jgi:two-component system chemotaxis sensor kinase CheA